MTPACLERTDGFRAQLVETYKAERPRLRRIAARWIGEDGAEEVVQDAVMKLWRFPERFDPARGSLGAYLAVLCRGAALDRMRSDASRRSRERRVAQWAQTAGCDGRPESGVPDRDVPDREVMVSRALYALPDRERAPILLAMYHGLSYREVASSLSLPEGTVKSRIRTGLRRMRDDLSPALT